MTWLFALLLGSVDPALGGFYVSSQPGVSAAIELSEDGSFDYAFEAGARSEVAQGSWTREGSSILLTARPNPDIPPSISQPGFAGQPLAIDGANLVLRRFDQTIRLTREGEPAPPPNRNTKLDRKD